ncbi:MAG: hypothetical protein ACK5HP_01240 [Bacilli bacterium]
MTRKDLYQKYLEALNKRADLENKINAIINKWADGETVFDTKTIEDAIEKGYSRLDELRKIEEKLHNDFMNQDAKEEIKKDADISVRHHLGINPSNLEITSGVLSSNAKESHLIGQKKSSEQLANEKVQLLNEINTKVMNKEISLAEASKLTNDVNISYGFYETIPEELSSENSMHR